MRTLILSLALAVSLGGVAQTVSQRVNDAISQTKTKYAPDKRQIIYDVKAVYAKDSSVTITGKTSEASVKQQLFDALKAEGIAFRRVGTATHFSGLSAGEPGT
jgi:hypothetical protein